MEVGDVQLILQLIDNLELLSSKLIVAFNENNIEEFNKYKKEMLATHSKISDITA